MYYSRLSVRLPLQLPIRSDLTPWSVVVLVQWQKLPMQASSVDKCSAMQCQGTNHVPGKSTSQQEAKEDGRRVVVVVVGPSLVLISYPKRERPREVQNGFLHCFGVIIIMMPMIIIIIILASIHGHVHVLVLVPALLR